MTINLIAIGCKMPKWVNETVTDYQKRLPQGWKWNLIELASCKRDKTPTAKVLEQEGKSILQKCNTSDFFITLDRCGNALSSAGLADSMQDWQDNNQNVAIIIGGPEGICPQVRAQARCEWSISDLTLPHPIVRVIMAEQFYRAWSIINNHPYHKGPC